MVQTIEQIDGFATASSVLTYLSKALNNKLNLVLPSADPLSDYARLDQALRAVMDARLALAAVRLKEIDASIAASGLVAAISAAADDAKKEADRIKKATKVVNELIAFVDDVTATVGLVGKILSL